MCFIQVFGELELYIQIKFCLLGYLYIFKIFNMVDENGELIGVYNDGLGWYIDYFYKEELVMCIMLYVVIVLEEGGDMLFVDQVVVYNDLFDDEKVVLDMFKIYYFLVYFIQNCDFNSYEIIDEFCCENFDVIYLLVCVYLVDGCKVLWVSIGIVKYILGMEDEEVMVLIECLVVYIMQFKYVYQYKWQKGDLLMWDNCCILYIGICYDDVKYQCMVYCLWVKGECLIVVWNIIEDV